MKSLLTCSGDSHLGSSGQYPLIDSTEALFFQLDESLFPPSPFYYHSSLVDSRERFKQMRMSTSTDVLSRGEEDESGKLQQNHPQQSSTNFGSSSPYSGTTDAHMSTSTDLLPTELQSNALDSSGNRFPSEYNTGNLPQQALTEFDGSPSFLGDEDYLTDAEGAKSPHPSEDSSHSSDDASGSTATRISSAEDSLASGKKRKRSVEDQKPPMSYTERRKESNKLSAEASRDRKNNHIEMMEKELKKGIQLYQAIYNAYHQTGFLEIPCRPIVEMHATIKAHVLTLLNESTGRPPHRIKQDPAFAIPVFLKPIADRKIEGTTRAERNRCSAQEYRDRKEKLIQNMEQELKEGILLYQAIDRVYCHAFTILPARCEILEERHQYWRRHALELLGGGAEMADEGTSTPDSLSTASLTRQKRVKLTKKKERILKLEEQLEEGIRLYEAIDRFYCSQFDLVPLNSEIVEERHEVARKRAMQCFNILIHADLGNSEKRKSPTSKQKPTSNMTKNEKRAFYNKTANDRISSRIIELEKEIAKGAEAFEKISKALAPQAKPSLKGLSSTEKYGYWKSQALQACRDHLRQPMETMAQ